jgi:hypothetical protein
MGGMDHVGACPNLVSRSKPVRTSDERTRDVVRHATVSTRYDDGFVDRTKLELMLSRARNSQSSNVLLVLPLLRRGARTLRGQ